MLNDTNNSSLNATEKRFLDATAAIIRREGYKNERQFLHLNGANLATLSKIRAGLLSVNKDFLQQLATKYSLNINFVLAGQGDMFLPSQPLSIAGESNAISAYKLIDAPFSDLPYVNMKASASFIESYATSMASEFSETYRVFMPMQKLPTDSIVIEIQGESMAEQLKSGTKVMAVPVNQGDWQYISGGVYAVLYKNYFVVKRIIDNNLMRDGFLMLHSDNQRFGSLPVAEDDIKGIWKVVRIIEGNVE